MRPREAPKRAQSRRKAQPGLGPGETLQRRVGPFGASPFGPGYPRALGGVAPLAQADAWAARRAYPSALGHPGAGASDCLSASQFDSLIKRPLADWIGRAFIGYSLAKMAICSADTGTGFFITIHSTPSLHGGVVSEPM